jgi:uncharacterized membrane protein (DUF4010 family)
VGYFLEKFLGVRKGMQFTSILGGLASTTVATAAFARASAEEPKKLTLYWQAATIANSIQFPRVLVLLYVMNPQLATAVLAPLAMMTAAGLLFGRLIQRLVGAGQELGEVSIRNPFRILPALKYGAAFTAILFLTKAAAAELGGDAVHWTSALGGSLDVDSVSVSLADLLGGGRVSLAVASASVLLALFTNAVAKTLIAFVAGGVSFGWRVATAFAAMFGAGVAVLWLSARF